MDVIKGAAQGTQSYELFNPLDIYQTEIHQALFRKVPRANSLAWMKKLKGRMSKRYTKRHVYSFYEEGQYMAASATIAVAANNGVKVDVTLSTGDHSSLGGGTNNHSFPVVNQLCIFIDGKTTGFVESIDRTSDGAHKVTIKKTDASMDVQAAAVVGTVVVFHSNAQPEKSTKTEGRVEQYSKVTNKMQAFREEFEVTDFEMQNAAWFPYNGKHYLYYKGIDSTVERFDVQKELGLLVQPESTALTDAAGKAVQTANGLLPQIRQGGTELEYFGRPDGAAFDEVMLDMDNNYGDYHYLVGCGHNLTLGLKDWLKEFNEGGSGNLTFGGLTDEGDEAGRKIALSLNLKTYSVGAYEFYFDKWSVFSHKDTLGAKGMPFRHYGVFIPMGYGKNTNPYGEGNSNNFENDYEPYCQVVYSPPQGAAHTIKGTYMMWETGALAKSGPTSGEMIREVHMEEYCALEIHNRNKFFLWKDAA